ncbi:MAG TPA: MscL family protein [Candidatus Saccharimonadales bacterium]|nr:MscL family protein [Candidatus Saccharimonadales bacterium]
MADKPNSNQLTPAQNRRREEREVASKLRNLGPVAQAEVVNDVITRQVSKQLSGFTDFLREQSVIGIGIGLVLGTQLKAVVDSITNGFVLPLTQLVLPNQKSLADQTFVLHAVHHRSVAIHWGSIVYALFNFLVVAFIVYMVFKALKLDRLAKKK